MKISLIVPCYNEEANIQKGVLDKIGNFTKDDSRFSEVLIVDDGSTDFSKKIIKEKYLPQFPKFKLIENPHQGKAFAIITGIKKAKSNYVMFSDIDLATPLEESEKLIGQAQKGYQIVIGSRNSKRAGAPFLRQLMAVGFIIIRNFLIGLGKIKDTQCGFKLFEKKAALKIIDNLKVFHNKRSAKGSSVSAGFDLEFLFLASRLKLKIKEVPVFWRHVETKNVNFLKDSLEALKDILKIKYFELTGKYDLLG
ncbi:MAG: glycosyltransferase [Microgenomates group bacterium]